MLLGTITAKDIQLGIPAENWEDAIRKAARTLLAGGAIEPRYIDAMVQSVQSNGPYIVLSAGVALAHARPECGVNRLALSFTTLAPGVPFGAGELDPIRLIITLAATDANSHIDLLSELADVLMDDARMETLLAAKTADEFCARLTA